MSLARIKSYLCGLALILLTSNTALAQRFQPFIDPGYFNPDFQFFAPVDVEEYGGEVKPNTGWYGGYDRMYVWTSRPQQEASHTTMDNTWGNRFDFGYMTEDNTGWMFSCTHVDGPNESDYLRVELINRWTDPQGAAGGGGGGQQTGLPPPLFPSTNRNNPFTGERTYDVQNSLNLGQLSNFEINKTFRLAPTHNGTVIEPFAGVRYTRFVDFTVRETYQRYDDLGIPIGVFPPPALDTAVYEQIVSNNSQITNDMFGGQLGFRMFLQRNRWNLNSEVRVFAMQNFQAYSHVTNISTAQYDGVGVDNDPILYAYDRVRLYAHDSEFVYGMEVRANAAFQVSREVALNFGLSFMDFGKGIGRGPDMTQNAQDLQMVGLNFGITVNR